MSEFLQIGAGGVLSHTMVDVPSDGTRWDASPAPTVTLHHRAGGVIGTASTAATTVAAVAVTSATAGAKAITLSTSTTALERLEEYMLGPNAAGQWEWVTIDGVSSTAVTVLDDLRYSYTSEASLTDHRMKLTVTEGDASSPETGCFAAWAYYVDGVLRIEHTTFAISRYAPRQSLTAAEAIGVFPRLIELLGSNQRVEVVLRRLWRRHVLPDVAKILGASGAVVAGESLEQAHLYKLGEQLAREAKDHESAERYSELYSAALDEMRTTVTDIDEDGGQSDDETPRGRRTPRMLRG